MAFTREQIKQKTQELGRAGASKDKIRQFVSAATKEAGFEKPGIISKTARLFDRPAGAPESKSALQDLLRPPKRAEKGGLKRGLKEVLQPTVGAAKGLASTIGGIAEIGLKGLEKITGVKAVGRRPQEVVPKPEGLAQKIGFGTEQVAEFFTPAKKVAAAEKVIRGSKIAKTLPFLAKLGKKAPRVAKTVEKLVKTGAVATTRAGEAAAVTAAQTGGDLEAIKTAGGIGAAFPLAGAGLRGGKQVIQKMFVTASEQASPLIKKSAEIINRFSNKKTGEALKVIRETPDDIAKTYRGAKTFQEGKAIRGKIFDPRYDQVVKQSTASIPASTPSQAANKYLDEFSPDRASFRKIAEKIRDRKTPWTVDELHVEQRRIRKKLPKNEFVWDGDHVGAAELREALRNELNRVEPAYKALGKEYAQATSFIKANGLIDESGAGVVGILSSGAIGAAIGGAPGIAVSLTAKSAKVQRFIIESIRTGKTGGDLFKDLTKRLNFLPKGERTKEVIRAFILSNIGKEGEL